jgi:cysteine desulfurase
MLRLDFNLNPTTNYDSKEIFERLFGQKATPTNRSGEVKAVEFKKELCGKFGFLDARFLQMGEDGYVWLFTKLLSLGHNKIAVSQKESVSVKKALKLLGHIDIEYINLNQNGTLNNTSLEDAVRSGCSAFFISPTDYDMHIVENLSNIRNIIKDALLVGDCSLLFDERVDICVLRGDRLGALSSCGAVLHNGILGEQNPSNIDIFSIATLLGALNARLMSPNNRHTKEYLKTVFEKEFGEDLVFFVEPQSCMENSLHIGLKGIKAGEFVRALAIDGIYITNGEACNMILKEPSLGLRACGYSEEMARWAISLSFNGIEKEEIDSAVKIIKLRYKQHIAIQKK